MCLSVAQWISDQSLYCKYLYVINLIPAHSFVIERMMNLLNAYMPVSNPRQVFWVKWVVSVLRLMSRKVSWCAVRAEDKSWVEAEWLTDSSCMRRWEASAGFTLLAFACLQLA